MNITKLYVHARNYLVILENQITSLFFGYSRQPPLPLLSVIENKGLPLQNSNQSLIDLLKDSFLFAVPKSRRTIAKRRCRRFGYPEYHWKMLVPKNNVLVCNNCGHFHEAGILCYNCYTRIREETEAMRKAIEAELKLDPVDKEVVVIYDKEIEGRGSEFWEGKRIVEMKKERPSWFCKNLIQKSTEDCTDSTNKVKPSDLA